MTDTSEKIIDIFQKFNEATTQAAKDIDDLNPDDQLFVSCYLEHIGRGLSQFIVNKYNLSHDEYVDADKKALHIFEKLEPNLTDK